MTVWINKNQTAAFIVDTGTNDSLISKSTVKKLGLTPYPALHPDNTPILWNDGKQAQAVTLSSLKIGGQKGSLDIDPLNGPVIVASDEQLRVSANRTVDGLIGMDILETFSVFFDLAKHIMILCIPGNLAPEQAKYFGCGELGGAILPLLQDVHGTYTVPVVLENSGIVVQTSLLIDTGSQTTEIPRREALSLSLVPLGQQPRAGLAGSYTATQTYLHRMSLGNLCLTNLLVSYANGVDHSPEIGMDILSGYKVLLDFPAKKMYLQPSVPAVKIGLPQSTPPAKK